MARDIFDDAWAGCALAKMNLSARQFRRGFRRCRSIRHRLTRIGVCVSRLYSSGTHNAAGNRKGTGAAPVP